MTLETRLVQGSAPFEVPRDSNVEQQVGVGVYLYRESNYDVFGAAECMKNANEQLITMMPELPKECRIIDAGCGTGVPTGQLLNRYPCARVYCVDRSDAMLIALRRKFIHDERVAIHQSDVTNLPEIPGEADAVAAFNMIHYLSSAERVAFFLSAASRMRRGGVVACCSGFFSGAKTPGTELFNAALVANIWDGLVARLGQVSHEVKKGLKRKYPSPEQYALSMRDAGLHVQACQTHDQIFTVRSICDFFRTDEAASGIFPMLDRDLAKDVLGQAIDRTTEKHPADATFPRKWLYLVGAKT